MYDFSWQYTPGVRNKDADTLCHLENKVSFIIHLKPRDDAVSHYKILNWMWLVPRSQVVYLVVIYH